MLDFFAGQYDIVVVGAGHAGIEAALAAARLGCRVLCLCTALEGIGNMPCNPSIGGTAKWISSTASAAHICAATEIFSITAAYR